MSFPKFKNPTLKFIAVFFVIISLTVLGLYTYNEILKKDLSEATSKTMKEILQQQSYNFSSEINAEMTMLNSVAINLSYQEDDIRKIMALLHELEKSSNFEYITIVNPRGKGIASTGDFVDISDQDFFNRALRGETVLSEPMLSNIHNTVVINLSTPLIKNDKINAVVVGSYNIANLNKLLLPSFEGKGYAFVVTSKGEIISRTTNDYMVTRSENLFDSWETAEFYSGDNLPTILANIRDKKSGSSGYIIQGEDRIAHYSPVGINDWYIFIAVPEDVVGSSAAQITGKTGYLATAIIICFMLFILHIFSMQKKSLKMREIYINELERVAYIDELTGARNFSKFKMDAQRLLEEYENTRYIIIKLDVENFRLLNEMHGFMEGDRILINISRALDRIIDRETEIYARIVADEFVILLRYSEEIEINKSGHRFEKLFYEFMGSDLRHSIMFPTGRYVIEPGETDISTIFEKVNFAHRMAKVSGKKKTYDYDSQMKIKAIEQKEIENKMEIALQREEFILYLQPKYRLKDEQIVGAEALVRWKKENIDLVYPGTFIPIFERNGFITKLDMYMLDKACGVIKGWIDSGIPPVTVSVNFSRLHINNKDFIDKICRTLDKYKIPRNTIEIELTETAIFDNVEVLKDVLFELHNAGFTLSMDDFGIGYSSLGLLKNLPVDVIKIDRSFFVDASDQHRSRAVIETILDMTKKLNIHTVAEGVEDREHIDLLRELGCETVQGYYYAKPMPSEEFSEMLVNHYGLE